jgi:hypothetical protein
VSVVVVGGNTRNIGKTSVVAGLIAAMPERQWLAVKITQFGHGVCSANGEACDCVTANHTMAVSEEKDARRGTDSSRYLAAGAARSFWVRTRQGQLHEAMPRVRKLIGSVKNVVIESNSVLRFLQPDVFLSVLDLEHADFKASALRYLDRADGVVLLSGPGENAEAARRIAGKPCFAAVPGEYCSAGLVEFVRARLGCGSSVALRNHNTDSLWK